MKKILVTTFEKNLEENKKMFEWVLNSGEVKIEVLPLESLYFAIENGQVEAKMGGKDIKNFDVVYIRSIDRTRSISTLLGKICRYFNVKLVEGKRYFNSSRGKPAQMLDALKAGISVPNTYFFDYFKETEILNKLFQKNDKLIFKQVNGAKGNGVFLVKSVQEILNILKENVGEKFFIQEFVPNSFDYRVLVCGQKVVSVSKRIRQEKGGDFKNNVYLGAREEFMNPDSLPKNLKNNLVSCVKNSQEEIVGFDLIENKNTWYCIEINSVPGLTENSPETDALKDFLSNY